MDRRNFLKTSGFAGSAATLLGGMTGTAATLAAPGVMSTSSARDAFANLLTTLAEVEQGYLGPDSGITQPQDIADGERFLMHILETGLHHWLEADPERPTFKRYVTADRKLLGDNPDALYYFAPIRGDRRYRITGNLRGATYTSFTIESGAGAGGRAEGSTAVLSDDQLTTDSEGNFEITLSAEKTTGNWLPLDPAAVQITTRHYFEQRESIAANPNAAVPLRIEALDQLTQTSGVSDASVAERINRVSRYMRSMTLDMPLNDSITASWVSRTPNVFNKPAPWGNEGGYGNLAATYCMAPFVVLPGQALVISAHFPKCRFANVMLWNRFLQTFDFVNRSCSYNRQQLSYEKNGSIRLIIAHEDPGTGNWLDTEGRLSGLVYWRVLFAEGEMDTPIANLVALDSLQT